MRGLVKVALEVMVGWGHQHGELPLSVMCKEGRGADHQFTFA